MLRIIQFSNGRYGLQNDWTGIVIDKQYRTLWGVKRARNKRNRGLNKVITRIQKKYP